MNQSDEDILEELKNWLIKLQSRKLTGWEEIPDIELYMDQVINYIDRQLSYIKPEEGEKALTASMVNNYVKLGTLPKPLGKKYGKEHIARLFPLCILKQILPLPVISAAIDDFTRLFDGREAFDRYSSLQNTALKNAADAAAGLLGGENSLSGLEVFAFELAIQAAANRIVAEKILAAVERAKEAGRGADKDSEAAKKEQEKVKRQAKQAERERLKTEREKEGKEHKK
ncbi:DUF1836 domain-containing protein [bacterium]|nr:DUF1836 domain-containing protein [bacterium]